MITPAQQHETAGALPEDGPLPEAWRPEVLEERKRMVQAGWSEATRLSRSTGYGAFREGSRLGINGERSVMVSRAEACGE